MVQAENKKLAEPLKKAKEELHRLKGMLGNHEKDKNALITTKAKLKVISKELEELRWEHEVLQQKYNQVTKEYTSTRVQCKKPVCRLPRKGRRSRSASAPPSLRSSRRLGSSTCSSRRRSSSSGTGIFIG